MNNATSTSSLLMDNTVSTATDASNYKSSEVDSTANSSRSSSEFANSTTTRSNVDTDSTTAGTYVSTNSAAHDVSDNNTSNDSSNTGISTIVSSSDSASAIIRTSPSTSIDDDVLTNSSITVSTSPATSISVSTSPSTHTNVSTSTSISTSTNISTSPHTTTSVRNNPSTTTTIETTTNVVSTNLGTGATTNINVNTSPSVRSDASLSSSTNGSFSTSNDMSTSSTISSSPSTNTKVSTSFTANDSISTKASSSPSSSTKVDVSTGSSFSHSGPSSQTAQTQTSGSYTKGRTTSDVTLSSGMTRDYFSSTTKTTSTGTTNSAAVSGGLPTTVSATSTGSIASISANQTNWIAAPVVCSAVLLAAVIIIVILVKLRRMPKCKFRRCFEKRKDGPYSSALTTSANEYARPVPIADFIAHVANLHRDSDFGFVSEFEMLKEQSPQFPKSAAELPENRSKNRYTNILPFDKDRVKLAPMDDDMTGASDYINASFLPGVLSRREYIATQGPLPGTMDDFWRMIWEYNVTTIVMVTDLVEDGKVLTSEYWPNQNEPVHYGDVRVEPKSEAVVGNYILRIFSVSLDDKSRLVKQFHLTNWRDRSSFNNVQQFLAFQGDVRRSLTNSPLLVHCSAGVGRTGTFIAVDHLLRQIESDSSIDVFHFVLEMRSHRTNMVQTLTQYSFVHDCISYMIEHAYHKGIPIPSGNSVRDSEEGNSEEDLIPLSTFRSNN